MPGTEQYVDWSWTGMFLGLSNHDYVVLCLGPVEASNESASPNPFSRLRGAGMGDTL